MNKKLEYIAAYNQLIYLAHQAPKPDMFLSRICNDVLQPVTSSPHNSLALQLNILSTVFNTMGVNSDARYHILLNVISAIRKSSSAASFEILRPQLKTLDSWLTAWEMDKEDRRKLYLSIHETASDANDDSASYTYLLKALSTLQEPSDIESEQAKTLSIKAITFALLDASTFDFSDLTSLDSIQALRKSTPAVFDLLEIFSTETLEDFQTFSNDHHPDFFSSSSTSSSTSRLSKEKEKLEDKMRLLTLTSLASSSTTSSQRILTYSAISSALKIPETDVEKWVIDVIRAGLVEGKLSQSTKTFLIHRATFRVFGTAQWRDVASRLDLWKESLERVLKVVREQRKEFEAESAGNNNTNAATNNGGEGKGNAWGRKNVTNGIEGEKKGFYNSTRGNAAGVGKGGSGIEVE